MFFLFLKFLKIIQREFDAFSNNVKNNLNSEEKKIISSLK
jgi:hypothetical protein